MKSIKNFEQFKFDKGNIFGGKIIATDNNGRCDTWDDKDNDGKLSPGDTLCFVECPEEPVDA